MSRMDKPTQTTSGTRGEEPRWLAAIAFLAVGGMYTALPASLVIIPNRVLLSLIALLLTLTIVTRWMERHQANQTLGYITNGIVTLALISSVALLVRALPLHRETPVELLCSSAALWVTNILVFALWYWRLDAGGPHRRDRRSGHREGAFLFPQMGMDDETREATNQTVWSPQFVDYLFLAFNTSAALSPTDVSPLSRWAKALMMVQASISLTVIVLIAARGVNVL